MICRIQDMHRQKTRRCQWWVLRAPISNGLKVKVTIKATEIESITAGTGILSSTTEEGGINKSRIYKVNGVKINKYRKERLAVTVCCTGILGHSPISPDHLTIRFREVLFYEDKYSNHGTRPLSANDCTICFKAQFRVNNCPEVFVRLLTFRRLTLNGCDFMCVACPVKSMIMSLVLDTFDWRQGSSNPFTNSSTAGPRLVSLPWSRLAITESSAYYFHTCSDTY